MKIYLDHCAYNRPFDDQHNIKIQLETSAKLYIQDQIRQGKYDLVWSYMSDLENSANPYSENKISIQSWENIAKYICKSTENILNLGKKIEQNGIRIKDSLHIACAIESQCEYFITTDTGLLNKQFNGIKIINPIDFVRIYGGKNEN
jgi:predicted nucleic acid-binding protein